MGEIQKQSLDFGAQLLIANQWILHDRVAMMARSALFSEVPSTACLDFAGKSREQAFVRNQKLFGQGDCVQSVGLIKSGTVKITQLSSSGSEVILWLTGAGESYGLVSLSVNRSHSCSAFATDRGAVILWSYRDFAAFVNENPVMRRNVAEVLGNRLEDLQVRFREIATEKIADRVAHLLARLAARLGRKTNEGYEIIVSREEIAQMTGTTLFAISRLLSSWETLGFVRARREVVVIADPKRLSAWTSSAEKSDQGLRLSV